MTELFESGIVEHTERTESGCECMIYTAAGGAQAYIRDGVGSCELPFRNALQIAQPRPKCVIGSSLL